MLRRRSKIRITGLCEGNPPATGGSPSQRALSVEEISIWLRHHVVNKSHISNINGFTITKSRQNKTTGNTWWRHQMETFSALLALCAGNQFPLPRPVFYAWINGWVNNRGAGDLRRHCAHYDVTVMRTRLWTMICCVFSGDLGGYLGLLVGATVLTVIEVFDLIIYNCVRKCNDRRKENHKQKKRKPSQGECSRFTHPSRTWMRR